MTILRGDVLDKISPTVVSIGIVGNIFMLSILFRWMQNYHINFCFSIKQNRPQGKNRKKSCSGLRSEYPLSQSAAIDFSMCLYLSFLTFTDLLCLIMELSFTLWRIPCLNRDKDDNEGNDCSKPVWASINLLITFFNAFKGNTKSIRI